MQSAKEASTQMAEGKQGGGVQMFHVSLVREEGVPYVSLAVELSDGQRHSINLAPHAADVLGLSLLTNAMKARETAPDVRRELAQGLRSLANTMERD
jgi:hypothetical protein